MITVLVQFDLPAPITHDQARERFQQSAPDYQGVDGLLRKYYLLSEDGKSAGGVYLWESRRQAESFYNDGWKSRIMERYGNEPRLSYFASPVVVDNITDQLLTG